jgi:hypothetical protein
MWKRYCNLNFFVNFLYFNLVVFWEQTENESDDSG